MTSCRAPSGWMRCFRGERLAHDSAGGFRYRRLMKPSLRFILLALTIVGWTLGASGAAPAPRPNIIFILADDLGWADVAFHHGNTPTPNLDKLAAQSVELTQHYVYPVC